QSARRRNRASGRGGCRGIPAGDRGTGTSGGFEWGARAARGTGPRIIRDVGAGGKERAVRHVTRPSAFSGKAFGNKGFVERSLQRWMRCDVRQAQQAALYGGRGAVVISGRRP